MEKQSRTVEKSLQKNMSYLKEVLHLPTTFDVVYKTLEVGEKCGCIYFVDGFAKDDMMEKILEVFSGVTKEDMPGNAHDFTKKYLPYIEAGLETDMNQMVTNLLSGMVLFFVDGYEQGITIDCRTYPMRSVEEPEKDKVLRGSRDGFVETLVYNTALIRRRIRNPELIMEMQSAGRSSKTDIVLCYMKDRADHSLLDTLRTKINSIQVDALNMNQQSLAECLFPSKWYNPFPKFKYSERPDTAAASVLEGNIVILVDNSPAAMILPTSIFDIIEEADDYYFPPITGNYLRLSRFLITIVTYILTPLFLLFMQNPEWIPEAFAFIKVKDTVNVPLILQLLLLELAIDGLRLAALNTPTILSTPLSVIAALVLGEFSVNSGWFNAEVMLYMAFVAVANYTQANFELGYALKFMRIITLILTWLFNLYGFLAGILITLLSIGFNRTISGKSYLYPLIPFKWQELKRRIFRIKL